MNISDVFHFFPSAYYIISRSPGLYKFVLFLTIASSLIPLFYGHKMYRESLKYHDFFIPSIRVFVEDKYNERSLTFDIESLSEIPVHLTQVQVAIYDHQKKEKALYQSSKSGKVNPLKKKDNIPFTFVLDNPPEMGFNFTKVIKEHGYVMQVYKIIIVAYYNHNSLSSKKEQRFEYLHNVSHNEGEIHETIREFPNPLMDSKQIFKEVPYEVKSQQN